MRHSIFRAPNKRYRCLWWPALFVSFLMLSACAASPPMIGMLYNHIQQPLTEALHNTPMPAQPLSSGNVLEIREPFTGLGFYGRINSNAMGPIAKEHGLKNLYFADEDYFSLLGVWSLKRVHLYGDNGQADTH